MEIRKLSHVLIDLGFFSALGTHQSCSDVSANTVKRGQPNTQDHNNGVLVVYDEEGRPWIMVLSKFNRDARQALSGFNLTQGAYVPHSNDGGHFVHEVMAEL